jgi:3-oxoacyl-[acyl-carrier protein] reductase
VVLGAAHNTRPKVGAASEDDINKSLTGNLHWPIVLIENLVRNTLLHPNSRIVVLSSDRARNPTSGSFLLSATKAGLESLVRSWAIELPSHFPGTTVNAVSVGAVDTPGLQATEDVEMRRREVRVVEGGRLGFPEEVADVVGWLVSEKSRWVTGSVVAANGGAEWVGGNA